MKKSELKKEEYECIACGERYICVKNPMFCSGCDRTAVRSIKNRFE